MKHATLALLSALGAASGLLVATPAPGPATPAGHPLPTNVGEGAYPDLAVDAAGAVHVVYVRDGALRYRKFLPETRAWEPEQNTGVPAGQPERSDPEIVIDSRNRPHVFCGATYASWSGTAWAAIPTGAVRDTALAIDSRDNVYLVRRGGFRGGHLGLLVRRPGAAAFERLPDPDIAGGLPLGRNDHVYGHVFVGPKDDALHVVYRHGAPKSCAYRVSRDGGATWSGGGVSDDDFEAPSGTVAARDGALYVVSGNGTVHRRTAGESLSWTGLGRAVTAAKRDLPEIAVDAAGNLYVTSFGGRFNILTGEGWAGEKRLPSPEGQKLGFAAVAGGPGAFAYVTWEAGPRVSNDAPAGVSDILLATLAPQ